LVDDLYTLSPEGEAFSQKIAVEKAVKEQKRNSLSVLEYYFCCCCRGHKGEAFDVCEQRLQVEADLAQMV
jgi:hypothetical protein